MKTKRVILPEHVIVTLKYGGGKMLITATKVLIGKYKDDQGKEQRGWTAVLSMRVKDQQEPQKSFPVSIGQSVQYKKVTIHILDIERSRNGMYVDAVLDTEG